MESMHEELFHSIAGATPADQLYYTKLTNVFETLREIWTNLAELHHVGILHNDIKIDQHTKLVLRI